MSFETLSSSVKQLIFTFLPNDCSNVAVVSKEWRQLFNTSRTSLDFSTVNRADKLALFQNLTRVQLARPQLAKLNLHSYLVSDQSFVESFSAPFEALTELQLFAGYHVSNESIQQLLCNTPNLSSLKISTLNFNDNMLKTVCSSLKKLKTLSLPDCSKITDVGTTYLSNSPNLAILETLEMKYSGLITPKGMRILGLSRYLRLSKLSLKCFDSVDSDGIQNLLCGLTLSNLSHLQISEFHEINDAALKYIAYSTKLKKLTHLDISNCPEISDEGIRQMCASRFINKQIKSLDLSGLPKLSDFGIGHICANLSNLENIDLEYCFSLTDESLHAIGKHLHKLHRLNLRGCELFTDDGIKAMVRGDLNNLQTLILGSHTKVTPASLLHIAESPNVKQLEHLALRFESNLLPETTSVLQHFTHDIVESNLPKLRFLEMYPIMDLNACVYGKIRRPCKTDCLVRLPEPLIHAMPYLSICS